MLKAEVGVARGATCGAVILTAALGGATVTPVASAGADGQGTVCITQLPWAT